MDRNARRDSAPFRGSEPDVALDVLPLHSTNLLTVLDENGIIQYESPAIERIYGFEQDELVGERVAEYFHPDDREQVVAAFRAVVAGDETTVEAIEYRHEQADGAYKWVESVASADPTPDGNYVVNTRDISAQKEREQKLEATNDRLEQFASIVSHDLRNPLNIAQLHVQLANDEHGSEHLDSVVRAHDRIEVLIDDVLALSRAGKQVAETESVALDALTEICWQTVPTADATLVVDTGRELVADRSRLQQLLENLVRNAVEHGGEAVTVTVGDLDTGFYVEDDGVGIPETERTRIFEAGISTTGSGTGLGLNIARQVADAHGWQIRCADGAAGGARFEITGVESP
jgi:PAS domain S-box-containing protein